MLIITPRKKRGHLGRWPVTEVRPRVQRGVGVSRAVDAASDGGEARGDERESSDGVGKRGKRATGEKERRDGSRVGDGGGGEEAFGAEHGDSKVARDGGAGGTC